ncbi:FecR family protein [Spirosoma sp. 209]|uniref:FecR family protein n=1 Tax=Spirosoma sp. 209 TaxID=1955701 RepID=UPI00098D0F4C|nr:FecR domain-containing protein [Spirosoma sp. 209]
MTQHDFQELARKYLQGDCTPEEERLMQEWADQTLTHAPPALSAAEESATSQHLWQRIAARTTRPPVRILYNRRLWAGMAATVLLLAVGSWWRWSTYSGSALADQPAHLRGVIDVKNTSAKPQTITLEDGSLVVLKPNSSVSYPEHFGNKTRSILLRGEAFFAVKRNLTKPFLVHTGDLVTEVLGTSFTIKSYDDAPAIEVLVRTGRVSVYEAERNAPRRRNGVILTPNQKVTFDKSTKKLLPGLTDAPTPVNPPAHRQTMVFDDTPLNDVISALQSAYGIEIVLENSQLMRCRLTADLNELALHTQLDLLCRSVGASYEQRGTVIFINGDGCR